MEDVGLQSLAEEFAQNQSDGNKLAQTHTNIDSDSSAASASTSTQEDMGLQWAFLTHSTVIVGYGKDKDSGEKYWIVRNSYGPSWGDNGNFKARRGQNDFGAEAESIGVTPIIY